MNNDIKNIAGGENAVCVIHIIDGNERYGVAAVLRVLYKNINSIRFISLANGLMSAEIPLEKMLWIGNYKLNIKVGVSTIKGIIEIALSLLEWVKVAKEISRQLPDESVILHCHSIYTVLIAGLTKKICKNKNIKILFHFHSTMNEKRLFGLLSYSQRLLINRIISGFIGVSYAVKKYWEPMKHPYWIIYNCVDDMKINGVPSYYINRKGKKNIIFAGSFSADKGYFVLLQAMKLLGEKVHEYHFWAAGGPIDVKINPFVQVCLNFVNKNNLSDNITFLGPVDNVRALIPLMWAGLQLRISPEPFGIWTLEMMSAGIPIIATSTGGTVELIVDHSNGMLIPPNDPYSLAFAINELDSNNELRISIAKNALGSSAKFSKTDFINQIKSVYDHFSK